MTSTWACREKVPVVTKTPIQPRRRRATTRATWSGLTDEVGVMHLAWPRTTSGVLLAGVPTSSCLTGVQGRIATVVDPAHIQGVARVGEVDNRQVEHEIREAAARLRVALHDVLQPFDERRAAELDVALDQRSPIAGDGGGSVDQQ